jgi:serine/threonine-protein kinase
MEKVKVSYILKLAVIGVLLMFISSAAITKIIFILSTISMPDFTGMPIDKAKRTASRMKIDLKIDDEIYSPLYKTGCLVSQDIQAHTDIKKGRAVYVVVSKGSKIVMIPDISARVKSDAVVQLRNAGLLEGYDTVVTSSMHADTTVIAQSPAPGQEAPAGIKINMLRSSGSRSTDYMMPELNGQNVFGVFSGLRGKNLVIEKLSVEPNEELPSGTILSQEPRPGYIVNSKTPVSLKASIKESDQTLKKRMITITYANTEALPALIKINILSLNGSDTVYNEMAQPNEPININAAVRGQALVQIFNGKDLVKELEINN